MNTVLVTGANGFIGHPLCAEMRRRKWQVTAAVRNGSQCTDGAKPAIIGAIDGGTDWTDALNGIEAVIHLAARVHMTRDPAADPLAEFLKVNLHGTENLARQAAQAGVKRFVYISSIKVNGERTKGEQTFSESDPADPQDPYAISKWQAEQALHRIAQETGLEVVIVRPPLVYGPGVKGNFLRLLKAVEKGIPLPLSGANNARSLVYVGNLIDALIACTTHTSASGQTYLVSDGDAVSTAALVAKMAQTLGRPNRSFYLPTGLLRAVATLAGRSDQVDKLLGSLRVSDQKIRRELGWTPSYSLEQGLHATANWYLVQQAGVEYNHAS